ncbi:type II secretion system secretin GspD [Hydrogenimonas cancrithermarum]|uniref:Type II secretion system protein GspD n=1 Tax=Hydrogenimonas cancrithermarum TaxID=2993563 RepID=A0ABN6WYX2_9BACT|nr:type II secretion system secretin GspD [Hydrogenimonas cancrithermarum]BDY13457.1 type II secretion system protein GspD [Hydrogenimonas cancrithermarum]
MRFINLFLLTALILPFGLQAKKITVNFNNTPIKDVIRFVAKQAHKNILITDRISGNVNFISEEPIDEKELLPLLSQILQNRGYTIIDGNNGYMMVTRAANAKKMATPGKSEAGMLTKIIPVHYLKASDAVQKLRYLSSQFASVTFDNNKNVIIMSDYPNHIENFEATLRKIDRPMKKEIRFIALDNADAIAAMKELNAIFKALSSTFRFPVTLNADAKSNKIVVIADTHDIERAVGIVKKYDSQNSAKEVMSDVIFLNNAEAAATVKILTGLMKSFDKQTQAHVSIQAKEDINAIAITGTPQAVKLITKVIKKLDIEQQQVYIKAHIYEISQNKLQNLGIKWGLAGGAVAGNTLLTSIFNMGGSSFVLPSSLTDTIDFGTTSKAVAVGAIIDLLKQNGAVNVVSEPNVLCINNKKSTVYIGKTISILTSQATGNDTTSITRNTYSREDIGLTLEVKPQIASDDKVLLEVKTKIEDIDRSSTVAADRPTTLKREVNTVSIVQNGESVIIGGLLKDYYSKGVSKVPLLGDLPFLGALFTSTNENRDQINVIVVLTPYIIKNSQSLAKIQEQIAKTEDLKTKLTKILQRELEAEKGNE